MPEGADIAILGTDSNQVDLPKGVQVTILAALRALARPQHPPQSPARLAGHPRTTPAYPPCAPHSKHGRIRSQLPIDDHRFPRNRRHHNQPSTPRHLVSLGTPRHHPRVRQIRRLAPRDRRHQYPRTPSSTSSIVRACARPCTPAPTITHSNGSLEARNRSNAPSPQPPASAPPSAPQQPSRPLA